MTTSAHRQRQPLPYDHYVDAIEREAARFAATVAAGKPTTAVPTCHGWTLADLTRHVGSVHRWFSVLLVRLDQEPPRSRQVDLDLPASEDALADWFSAGLPQVSAVLRATDPQDAMWAWGPDHHARFWARRMLFETLVHRVDAERALGLSPTIDPALAADGVDEFLVNLPYAGSFAPDVAKLRGTDEAIRFQSIDPDPDPDAAGDWVVRLRPDGFGIEPEPEPVRPEQARVRGRAADLLLLIYGRMTYSDGAFDVWGDEQLLTRWFTHSTF
ncbi:maleylpyruvate isomerase family mycothiol-dependent enzyme [Streptomyces sp. NPDC005202]|uniref:maleylpyruvate isomerase family mycothiol-dependent enzyme n=1 Tax=Streptomyces sp. NPDC005202 TaxID=3157021 RepID=UPI0033A24EEB